MREQEKFSKHRIEQLAIVKEANILVSLSNSQVSLHDLQTFDLQETLEKAKGSSTFAVTSNIVKDASTAINSIVSRLAIAVKRKLILWSWHDSELLPETTEIALITTIKTLTWATGTKLVAGLASSYVLVDVETSVVTDIVGPGSIGGAPGQDGGRFGGAGVAGIGYMGIGGGAPKPLATKLGDGELLLAKDINTFFMDTDGNSLGRRQIPWPIAPEAIGYSYPYLLSLQATKGTLEIRNPETLTPLQTISLPNASQFHVPQPNVSLAHAGKGFLVLSDRCIWRMKALDYDSQIDSLVERNRLDEAISLLGMLEDALLNDKQGRLRSIKVLKAEILFGERRFRESLDLFTEISAPPGNVIRLYPPVIAGGASNFSEKHNNKEDGSGHSPEHPRSPTHHKELPVLEGKDLKTATQELRPFLVSIRTKLQRFLNPDGSVKQPELKRYSDSKDVLPIECEELLEPPDVDEESSKEQQLQDVAKLVDTTLFRAYMFSSPSLAGPLFRIDNFCNPDVVNERLIENERYTDLVDFFYGKKLHRQALELLKKFGDTKKENKAAPQLAGPQRTVLYLKSLPPEQIDLILQYGEWPLKKDPDLGMEVFLADTENAETLPRQVVLDFLHRIDQKLEIRYLEHVIHELNDTTPDFHQRLVDVYIDRLKSKQFANAEDRNSFQEKAIDFLRSSGHYHAYKALQKLSPDGESLHHVRLPLLISF